MMTLCSEVLKALRGRTLATAESLTGGGIGNAITAVPGSSSVFKGGIISYCNEIKHALLGVDAAILDSLGPVSAPVAQQMAVGARKAMGADVAVSVTGLAGPGDDEFGNSQGTVYIGYADDRVVISQKHLFVGERESVRRQTVEAALRLVLDRNTFGD